MAGFCLRYNGFYNQFKSRKSWECPRCGHQEMDYTSREVYCEYCKEVYYFNQHRSLRDLNKKHKEK